MYIICLIVIFILDSATMDFPEAMRVPIDGSILFFPLLLPYHYQIAQSKLTWVQDFQGRYFCVVEPMGNEFRVHLFNKRNKFEFFVRAAYSVYSLFIFLCLVIMGMQGMPSRVIIHIAL
jgi:hypothetical protein